MDEDFAIEVLEEINTFSLSLSDLVMKLLDL